MSEMATNKSSNFTAVNSLGKLPGCTTLQTDIQDYTTTSLQISSVLAVSCHIPLSLFATIVNALIFVTLLRKRELRIPGNLILTSMSVSDFCVGSIMHPAISALIISDLIEVSSCKIKIIVNYAGLLCVSGSFSTIVMFALDRVFATFFPFIYAKDNTYKVYAVIISCTWFTLILCVVLNVAGVLSSAALNSFMSALVSCAFLLVCISYISVYLVIRSQRKKISSIKVGAIAQLDQKDFTFKVQNQEMGHSSSLTFDADSVRKTTDHFDGNAEVPQLKKHVIQVHEDQRHEAQVHTQPDKSNSLTDKIPVEHRQTIFFIENDAVPNKATLFQEDQSQEDNAKAARAKEDGEKIIECNVDQCHMQAKRKEKHRVQKLKANLKNKARLNTVAIVTFLFLLFYLPLTLFDTTKLHTKMGNAEERIAYQWLNLLLLLNSSINPIIYCIRVTKIRREVERVMLMLKTRLFGSSVSNDL